MLASYQILHFIAEASPAPKELGSWIIAAGLIVSIGTNVLLAIAAFRRQPPIGEMLHKEFATKAEMEVVRTEAANSVRRLHQRIDDLISGNDVYFREAERVRGNMLAKIETIEKSLATLHSEIRELTMTRR